MFGIEKDYQKLLEQVYGPLGEKPQMTEIEKVKEEIKVLEKKLSFLEELEKTKSPAEEAFKRIHGYYANTEVDDYGRPYDMDWRPFRIGYNAAQEDYKVGEYQEPVPEEEQKTLYQIFRENDRSEAVSHVLCDIVKEWMFQYDCDYSMNADYLEGYQECQTVLEERLR